MYCHRQLEHLFRSVMSLRRCSMMMMMMMMTKMMSEGLNSLMWKHNSFEVQMSA